MRNNNLTSGPISSISLSAGEGVLIEQDGEEYTITMEDAVPYAVRIDQAADEVTYYTGYAAASSATASAVWRIKKTVLSASSDDVTVTWADGDTLFNNVWDNRLSLTYS